MRRPHHLLSRLLALAVLVVAKAQACMGGDQQGLADVRKFLGGDIEIDFSSIPLIKYPSILGQVKISYACDLNCDNFDALFTAPCRWRNEWTTCSGHGDQLDWVRAKNGWGTDEGLTIFGTEERASRFYIMTGSRKKLPPDASALFVSDPVQCQEGDGILQFRYWTSPGTRIRVCFRKPGFGKAYDWCAADISVGDPGPARVVIPGSIMYTFELVIEAKNFNYDAFGFQGGAVIIDDIFYNTSAVYNCRYIPHVEPLPQMSPKTCQTVECSFDQGGCLDRLSGTGWRIGTEAVGNMHTGIRSAHDGSFGYARGPGTRTLRLGKFHIVRQAILEFCYYASSRNSHLSIYSTINGYNRSRIFTSDEIVNQTPQWTCKQVILQEGKYDSMEFLAEGLSNQYSYVGLDSITLIDPITWKGMCAAKQSLIETPTVTNALSIAEVMAQSPQNITKWITQA
ncbi:hypothetical protein QR680_017713 [Steinernema hermaphroditum]|uniref:MAM domain-containing protein n=1 Tax=Steinernema hermaphroditum TaxID=289476 RepID=A0AA39HHY4_9BILA|nr:hypothetical protein QR680_017713 [Steinernema hermaphroditum]